MVFKLHRGVEGIKGRIFKCTHDADPMALGRNVKRPAACIARFRLHFNVDAAAGK